jgi:hypothetical protein
MNFNHNDYDLNFNSGYSDLCQQQPPFDNTTYRIPGIPGFPGFPGSPGSGPGFQPGTPPSGNNLNIGPPPNITPKKNDPGVQSFSAGASTSGGATQFVSPGSISFCLFKFTYIWERRGRNYWTYILNVDRRSVSGLRWFYGRWAFWGIELRQIDSFVCFRDSATCTTCSNTRSDVAESFEYKKEYTHTGQKNVYTRVLTSINVPEVKDDFILDYLGEVDGEEVTARVPCKKTRNNKYRIVLKLTYPTKFHKSLVDDLNAAALDASYKAEGTLNEFRNSDDFFTPLDIFDFSTQNIDKALNVFTTEFYLKIRNLRLSKDALKDVDFSIIQEKVSEDWHVL